MATGTHGSQTKDSLKNLSLIFVSWKALLFLIALTSPGVGYDTSSDLLLSLGHDFRDAPDVPDSISRSILKFVRWDAIYHVEIARNGHVFEQEWAWGKGLSTVLSAATKAIGPKGSGGPTQYTVTGIMLSTVSHWLSVLLLFLIAKLLQPLSASETSVVPFVTAVLHIMSPAGIFLLAPYSESLFSLLNLLGFFLYIKSKPKTSNDVSAAGLMFNLLAGLSFGLASAVRGNGILSGVPFFIDAIETLWDLVNPQLDNFTKSRLLLQLQFTVLAGCCVAAGLIYPQLLAYQEYCVDVIERRPWCSRLPPSIFAFVQAHYWNVGFLRYWTLSNLPLFLLAAPCLYILMFSGIQSSRPALSSTATPLQKLHLKLALPQLLLTLLAFTNYHVQIITRLSSGYPMWYIWLATRIQEEKHAGTAVRILTMYALIQAALFASFLPPA